MTVIHDDNSTLLTHTRKDDFAKGLFMNYCYAVSDIYAFLLFVFYCFDLVKYLFPNLTNAA
jgi:hypothetical protein